MTPRHNRGLRRGAALAAAALLSAGAASPAAARPPTAAFTLQPLGPSAAHGYFVWEGRPGRHEGRVRVTNVGRRTGVVDLYVVDGETSPRSGVAFHPRTDPRQDVAAWASVSRTRLLLQPGRSRVVRVRVVVPRGVRPGQHVGGLVADNPVLSDAGAVKAGSAARKARFAVKLHTLRAIALQLNVPGPSRDALAVDAVSTASAPGLQEIRTALRNDGELMLKPRGTLRVADGHGRTVVERRLALDTILPRTAIDYPAAVLTHPLRPGRYSANVVLRYGHGREADFSGPFTVSERQADAARSPGAAPAALSAPRDRIPPLVIVLVGALALALAASAIYAVRIRARLARSGPDGRP